jgi:Uri superfamily endonuclease
MRALKEQTVKRFGCSDCSLVLPQSRKMYVFSHERKASMKEKETGETQKQEAALRDLVF